MTEIKSVSDEELAQLAKGSSGGLSKEQPQPVPKPYMAFDAPARCSRKAAFRA